MKTHTNFTTFPLSTLPRVIPEQTELHNFHKNISEEENNTHQLVHILVTFRMRIASFMGTKLNRMSLSFVLFTDTWSQVRTFSVIYDHTLFYICKSLKFDIMPQVN